jgi:hypothetical protein
MKKQAEEINNRFLQPVFFIKTSLVLAHFLPMFTCLKQLNFIIYKKVDDRQVKLLYVLFCCTSYF